MTTTNSNSTNNFSNVNINVNGELKRPAYTLFNRDLNIPNMELITEKMMKKGYRKGEPIQVVDIALAESLDITVFLDINGKKIDKADYEDCCLVVDGFHRTHAASRYNDWLEEQGKETITIPAIEIELVGDESLTEYINEINCTKLEWKKEDYVKGAACVFPEIELLQVFKEHIRTDSKKDGYPLSTLNKIYCGGGRGKGLHKTDLVLLCYGHKKKGKNNDKDIIPKHNIERGDRFIETCNAAGFKQKDIAKRYLITEFKDLWHEESEEFAFQLFAQITKDDISSMVNKFEFLNEEKVKAHFIVMKERLKEKQQNKTTKNE